MKEIFKKTSTELRQEKTTANDGTRTRIKAAGLFDSDLDSAHGLGAVVTSFQVQTNDAGPMKTIVIAGEPLVIAVAGWTCKRTTTSTTSCIAYPGTRQGHWRVALIFLIPEVEIFWFPAAMLDDITSRR